MDQLEIRQDSSDAQPVAELLARHLAEMSAITPGESVHALNPDALISTDLTFWTAWVGDELLGCGALRELAPEFGEVKSMHTAAEQRGKGVASRILKKIVEEAVRRRYKRLYLETGATDQFAGARGFYKVRGFVPCGPFGDYGQDPNSVFMVKEL